jgi:hypothetical protein
VAALSPDRSKGLDAIRLAEGDPLAPVIEALKQAKTGITQEDLERLAYEAGAGAQAVSGKLAQAAMQAAWVRLGGLGLGLLIAGLVLGWLAHTPDWGSWPIADAPKCQNGVCWVAFRLSP